MRNRSPFGQSFDCPFFCAFLRGFRCIFSYYSFYNGLLFGKYDRCFHQRAQKAAIIIGADCSAFVVNANVTRGEETHMKYITVMIIILVLLSFIGRCSPSPWQRTSCTITVTVRTDGTFIGGAYEYICSVFTEIFWGIATVVDKISNQMILKRLTMYFIIPTGDFFPILSVIIWL